MTHQNLTISSGAYFRLPSIEVAEWLEAAEILQVIEQQQQIETLAAGGGLLDKKDVKEISARSKKLLAKIDALPPPPKGIQPGHSPLAGPDWW